MFTSGDLATHRRGRIMPIYEGPGTVQMQIDRWLLGEFVAGRQPPTLRFYQWSPVAISLGYHQRHYPEHWRSLTYQDRAVDLVRRPSGGRAVLHQGELTYGLVTSHRGGKPLGQYRQLCEFLIRGWRSLGVELGYGDCQGAYRHEDNCFAAATAADLITPKGHKLIGSAQWRHQGALLQHGSMGLASDPELWRSVFGTTLTTLPTPVYPPADLVMEALIIAAQELWPLDWQVQPLTDQEVAAAQASESDLGES
jgi:lipoate---protein ligase